MHPLCTRRLFTYARDMDLIARLTTYFDQPDHDQSGAGRPAADLLAGLVTAGLDALPLPGRGATFLRWRCLALVASHDLSLAKLYEGHTDALAILSALQAPIAGNATWGVWCAEVPGAQVVVHPSNESGVLTHLASVRLTGNKAWCSGAANLQHALLSVRSVEGTNYLAAVDLASAGISIDATQWAAIGMAQSASLDVRFEDVPATLVGEAGAYLDRPGFWHGGAGIAACWYGAAAAIAHCTRGQFARTADPHFLAHLGAIDVALRGASVTLHRLAEQIDRVPGSAAMTAVLQARAQTEDAATAVMTHAGRALGAAPLCRDPSFARKMTDLPVFLRQSHAERDLAFLGSQLLMGEQRPWQL